MTGGFSRAIHLVQAAYGWATDAIVLEMPLCRFRQKLEIIQQNKTEDARFQARVTEWHAKSIVVGLSTLYEGKDSQKVYTKLLKGMHLPMADEDTTDTRSIEEIMEQGAIIDLDEQPSFEHLSGAFGQLETSETEQ